MNKSILSYIHREYFQKTRLDPKDYRNWLTLGWTAKDPAMAISYFERALQLAPNDPVVLDSLAWAKENLNKGVIDIDIHRPSASILTPLKNAGQNALFRAETKNANTPAGLVEENYSKRAVIYVFIYLALIAAAEGLSSNFFEVRSGLIFHSIILVGLILHSALIHDQSEQRLYLTLAFAPLIRLVSLSIPLKNIPMMYWYFLVGAPIFISIILVSRYTGYNLKQIGFNLHGWPGQILFGFVGIGLGYFEYVILRPAPLIKELTWSEIWLPALILVIFTGLLEEVIFRGLMQQAFSRLLGRWNGLVYVSALFAVMHVGYKSLGDVAFVFGVAMLFGLLVSYTGSILGATIAHGLTNITLFLVFPFLAGQPILAERQPGMVDEKIQVVITLPHSFEYYRTKENEPSKNIDLFVDAPVHQLNSISDTLVFHVAHNLVPDNKQAREMEVFNILNDIPIEYNINQVVQRINPYRLRHMHQFQDA